MTTIQKSLEEMPHGITDLTAADLMSMYRYMALTRALFERMWLLQRGGKTSFIVTGEGQEATQVGMAYAMDKTVDIFLPYYRDLGVVLVAGMSPREVLLNVLGKAEDPNSGGRQLPSHYFHPTLRIVSGSSPVATQVPHAAGIALAAKIRREGSVAICSFGEGGTSTGDFHEGMNFAGIHRLPVIFVCENNGYAISVPQSKQSAIQDLAERAAGYGFTGLTVDGNDVLEMYQATRQAARRARSGHGPTLIEAKTYRYAPHTSNDDPSRYRTAHETELWRARDPLLRFKKFLAERDLLDEAEERKLAQETSEQVNDATRYAESRPVAEPQTVLDHVYAG